MCDAFFDYDLTNGTTNSSMVHNIIEVNYTNNNLVFHTDQKLILYFYIYILFDLINFF